jgi:hypothetical protein
MLPNDSFAAPGLTRAGGIGFDDQTEMIELLDHARGAGRKARKRRGSKPRRFLEPSRRRNDSRSREI